MPLLADLFLTTKYFLLGDYSLTMFIFLRRESLLLTTTVSGDIA